MPFAIDAEREGVGCKASPACRRCRAHNTLGQYLFRQWPAGARQSVIGAVRAAYSDYLAARPASLLALLSRSRPARSRQRAPGQDRSAFRAARWCALIVRALKEAGADGQRAATTGGGATIAAFRPLGQAAVAVTTGGARHRGRSGGFVHPQRRSAGFCRSRASAFEVGEPSADARIESFEPAAELIERPSARRVRRCTETYIVARPATG